jgi:hypothetical protein
MKRRSIVFASIASAARVALALRRKLSRRQLGVRAVNDQFHGAYARLRTNEAQAAPILVVLGDSLHLLSGHEHSEFVFKADTTAQIKSAAHAPVGIFVALAPESDATTLHAGARQRLAGMRAALEQAVVDVVDIAGLDRASRADVEMVLRDCVAFIDQTLSTGSSNRSALSDFAARMGPLLLRLTEHGTRMDFNALHTAVEAALGKLSERERGRLEVVVAGAHQARARNLAMQYFQKRFGEAPGEERRLTFAEAVGDVKQACELVGTRRLDRTIASAFFGDAKRLQRDVQGDAASRLVEQSELGQIERG